MMSNLVVVARCLVYRGITIRNNLMNPSRPSKRSGNGLHISLASTLPIHQKVCVALPESESHRDISYDIANKLNLPIVNHDGNDLLVENNLDIDTFDNCIHILPYQNYSLNSYAISIQPINNDNSKPKRQSKKSKIPPMQPFFIDFSPPQKSKLGQRLEKQMNQKGGEKLLKAVAPHKFGEDGKGAIVFDLNAGFGQDSMIIAGGGANQVHMIERDPIVGLLLADAMRRLELIAHLNPHEIGIENCDEIMRARDLNDRLFLHQDDSIQFSKLIRLQHEDEKTDILPRPDICYLDPMFPPRTKSSAVKKNMQILHGLFQNNEGNQSRIEEEQNLLKESLMLAKNRVVVKRPIKAQSLGIENGIVNEAIRMPSYDLKGSINRFDVYVLNQTS